MFVHKAAVIGGGGGGSYSHAAELEAAGFCLGAGPNCMRLSELHVEKWQVLSHHSATYTSIRDPTQTFKPPGRSNIRTDTSTDFHIPADHRVRRVCAAAGELHWAAAAHCLNLLEIETVPVAGEDAEEGQAQVTGIGSCSLDEEEAFLQPGSTRWQYSSATCKVVAIPKGLTLVGIAGRAGDSWDQVSLLVGPWLPMGGWSPSTHQHLVTPFKQQAVAILLCLHQLQASAAINPLDKQVTECLVAALFDATFMAQPAAAAGSSTRQAAAHGAQAAEGAGSSTQQAALHGALAAAAAGSSKQRAGTKVLGTAAADDFVAAWVRQQVQQAMAECEKVVRIFPNNTPGVGNGYDSDDSQKAWV